MQPPRVSRVAYAASIAAVCIVFAACGGGGAAGGASTTTGGGTSPSPSSSASAEGYPVTIQNCGPRIAPSSISARSSASATARYFEASLEAVAGKQADAFVIFADYQDATDTLDGTKEAQFLFETFPNMQASKDRRVAITDYTYTSPGWRIAQTVDDFARQLHPDAFK